MNLKIIVFILLSISTQYSLCMILPSTNKKNVQFLKQIDLFKQKKLPCSCENIVYDITLDSNKPERVSQLRDNSLYALQQLPIDIAKIIVAQMFDKDDKNAVDHFFSLPFQNAIDQYSQLSEWKQIIPLPNEIIFRLNEKQKKVIASLFENQAIYNADEENVIKSLNEDIAAELSK